MNLIYSPHALYAMHIICVIYIIHVIYLIYVFYAIYVICVMHLREWWTATWLKGLYINLSHIHKRTILVHYNQHQPYSYWPLVNVYLVQGQQEYMVEFDQVQGYC